MDTPPIKNNGTGRLLNALKKEYVLVGKTRVKGWYAWLIIGLAAGIAVGIILVANRSGEVEPSIAQVSSAGLVAYWNFNKSSGATATDASGNGYTAQVNGASWVSGKVLNALSFDGVNDYVSVPDAPAFHLGPSGSLTFSAWIKTTMNGRGVILDRFGNNGFMHLLIIDGKTYLLFRDAKDKRYYAGGTTLVNNGLWHHIAGVWDEAGFKARIYIDGKEDPISWSIIDGVLGDFTPDSIPIQIGRNFYAYTGNASYFFKGLIDEVRVYNRALSNAEITNLLNN